MYFFNFSDFPVVLNILKIESESEIESTKTSKFEGTLHEIKIEKFISVLIWACQALIWATIFLWFQLY